MYDDTHHDSLIGFSPAADTLRRHVARVARSHATVLVQGESGVGKEVVAAAIHHQSDRAAHRFVKVRPMQPGDLEAAFDEAAGGSLLLDEVSDWSPAVQSGLIRLIEGGHDARLIATTCRDLSAQVREGLFRADLYYRLDVLPMTVPALRERREDLADFARAALAAIARRDGMPLRRLEPMAVRLLERHDWPGNVRELQNMLERASALETEPGVIRAETLRPWLVEEPTSLRLTWDRQPLAEVEKRTILAALDHHAGHRAKTAEALGIGVRTLGMKLKKWKETGEWDGGCRLAA